MKPVAERRNYKSVFDAVQRVIREEGVRRLYSGLAPNIGRGMAMNAGMMAVYDQAKEFMMTLTGNKDTNNPSLTVKLGSSAIAGFCAAFFSLPFDLIKSRLQDMRVNPETGKPLYSGVFDCAQQILRKEGVAAFWTGFLAYYGRCAPHAMIILMSMESISSMYDRIFKRI